METYRGGSTNKGLRRLLRKYAEGGAFYDPMGNVTMPPEEGPAPSPMYEQAMDAIAKAGAAVGSPVTRALQTAADVYSNKSREAASENEELRRQAMRNMAGDRAGMVPVGAGQMLLSQLGTAALPLTAAAKTIGHAATQATGNPRFGEQVELLSGFVGPSHVGMLKATAPMADAAAARQAVQVAREVTPVAQATRELSPLGFYSHGAETAANLAQAKGAPDQMAAMLRKYGVKPDELYNAGIADETATNVMRSKIEREYAPKLAAAKLEMDALGLNENTIDKKSPDYNKALDIRKSPETKAKYQYDSTLNAMRSEMDRALVLGDEWSARPSVTREELAKHFKERRPQVEETVLRGNKLTEAEMEERGQLHWMQRTPEQEARYQELSNNTGPKFQKYTLPGGENYREVLLKEPDTGDMNTPPKFMSSHWDDPNVLAHIRMSDRTGPNGEKILHVEEIQSDWGQKGKKEGFDTPERAKKIADLLEEERNLLNRFRDLIQQRAGLEPKSGGVGEPLEYPEGYSPELAARLTREIRNTRSEIIATRDKIPGPVFPTAPYVTNTAAWTDLALKRALREAAEGGYDRLVWTPGAEQAKRYPEGGPKREEGMKAYYDKIVPNQLSKLVKKLDPEAKIEKGRLPVQNYTISAPDIARELGMTVDEIAALPHAEKMELISKVRHSISAPGLTITPKMREAIMKGQTDFARGGAVKGYAKGGPANNSLEALYNKYAAPTMRQRTRKTVAGIDPERDRDQPVIDPATMGEEWNRARRNYQNFPRQEGEAVARPLELGARDRLAGYIAGGAREPGAQSRRSLADLLLGSTGLPDSGTLGVGVADLPMVTGIPLALADIVHDIGQGDYASTAMGAALPAAFYARGPLGAAGKRAVKIANDYAKPIAGVAGVAATMTPDDAEAGALSRLMRAYHGSPENADHIAFLLRNGRGTEVTNALAGTADPITLLRHYLSGGTGAEMPMGRAARIGRAKEGGYHTEKPYYHAGDPKTAFDNSRGELYATTDKSFAKAYRADKNYGDVRSLLSRHQNTIEGDDVIDFFHNKVSSRDPSSVNIKYGWQAFDPDHLAAVGGDPRDASKLLPALKKEGFDSAFFPEDFPPTSSYTDPSSSRAFFYPETLRDISARFDPRLSHVSNLDYAQGGEVKNYARGGSVEGYAKGGPVSSAAIYDPAEIDALAASIIEGNYA